jgi:diguanylate cyclase (GGDEF)-like protein
MMRAIAQSLVQAEADPLTGLLNRRALENRVRKLRAEHMPFALAMADLDHFKDLNDTFGHDTGDRALRLFARVAQNAVRDGDLVSRHGGEEFVFVLVGSDANDSAPVLNRLRERLAEALAGAQLPPFTVSAGIVDSTWSDDLPELLEHADRALLQAKASGRDRIVVAEIDAAGTDHAYSTWNGTVASDPVGDDAPSITPTSDGGADGPAPAQVGGTASV